MTVQVLSMDHPHPDVDLATLRSSLNYMISVPSSGIDGDTGLIVYIGGFGSKYNNDYTKSLLPHLSDKYNCIAISCDYFDSQVNLFYEALPSPDFFLQLKEKHGIAVSAPAGMDMKVLLRSLLEGLHGQGITKLDAACTVVKCGSGYMSFGLMPALDVLSIVGKVIIEYNINRRRMFVIGTSYGGYIATLISKFAPNTFRLIIDNSGFSGPQDNMAMIYGAGSATLGGVKVKALSERAFTPHPMSPEWFSPHRMAIRDLAVPAHYHLESRTTIHAYHSVEDAVAPAACKRAVAAIIGGTRRYHLSMMSQADIDGRVFKTLAHGMNASMRGLFERSYCRWLADGDPALDTTDFDMRTVNHLDCGDVTYQLTFSRADVRLDILPFPGRPC